MKRFLAILTITLLTSMYCMAGGVKVKEGKAAFFKENASAVVEFDFSKPLGKRMRILRHGAATNMKSV